MATPSTKQKLLSLIEDVEIVMKELFGVMCMPKGQRPEGYETGELINLLVQKDKDIQESIKIAGEQGELQKKLEELKSEVDKRDHDIKNLQKNLKEAEGILATAIYQAKQKLKSINKANSRKISSEELIKYAHMISSTNAVAAPTSWAPGDPRRPYPTDIDMLRSELAKSGGTSGGGGSSVPTPTLHTQSSLSESLAARGGPGLERTLSHPGSTLSWQSSMGDMGTSSLSTPAHLPGQSHTQSHGHPTPPAMSAREHEEVEIMSSDSSSSSSSDE